MKAVAVLFMGLLATTPVTCTAWDSAELSQAVRIGDMDIRFPEFAVFRLPGSKLSVSSGSPIKLLGETSQAIQENISELTVPDQPGWYQYRLANSNTGEVLLLRVFALIPYGQVSREGYIGEYEIGHYPSQRLRDLSIYDPPAGFIRVNEEDQAIQVSPNFTIGQFLSKQAGGFPKYLVLSSALLIKLERILRALNEAGHDVGSLYVMSGYRTPVYNKAIGNVKYSRHQWGGAADIYVDVNPKNDWMDDLNGDNVANNQDAAWLVKFIDDMARAGKFKHLGGLGVYGNNSAHGPFVHVDVRGFRARW